jgi:hypothetical protein
MTIKNSFQLRQALFTICIATLISSCSNSKYAKYIEDDRKKLVEIDKNLANHSESEKIIGCWTSEPQKMLESGETIGEKMLENTQILIFYKDSSYDEITLIKAGFVNSDPIIYHRPYYKVLNGQFITKNEEKENSMPIEITESSIVLNGTTYKKGNCSE